MLIGCEEVQIRLFIKKAIYSLFFLQWISQSFIYIQNSFFIGKSSKQKLRLDLNSEETFYNL